MEARGPNYLDLTSSNSFGPLQFKPNDFIALLTQHIPDRYQNMRRYAGFYAANVRLRIQRAQAEENKEVFGDGGSIIEPLRVNFSRPSLRSLKPLL
jgi:hypothetical protein